jgi:hypothetical protein
MDWTVLAQEGDQWMDLVNTLMNFRVRKMSGSSSIAAQLAASLEGLSSMKSGYVL